MIDFQAVRRAYHSPPPPGDHVPTVEERIAAYERQRMADAIRRGIDPRAAAIGEHGSLIGGPGKPPTRFEGGPPRRRHGKNAPHAPSMVRPQKRPPPHPKPQSPPIPRNPSRRPPSRPKPPPHRPNPPPPPNRRPPNPNRSPPSRTIPLPPPNDRTRVPPIPRRPDHPRSSPRNAPLRLQNAGEDALDQPVRVTTVRLVCPDGLRREGILPSLAPKGALPTKSNHAPTTRQEPAP